MSRKLVEITKADGTKYHDTFQEAAEIAKSTPHIWEGARKLRLGSKASNVVKWAPRQSGRCGPLTLQVITH